MIRGTMLRGTIPVILAATLGLAGCQTYGTQSSAPAPQPVAMSPLDGAWSSTDGVFVATFQRGGFVSRFVKTNEILAQGVYTMNGPTVQMQWMSVATQQQRAATCNFVSADAITCNQDGGGSFQLRRSA